MSLKDLIAAVLGTSPAKTTTSNQSSSPTSPAASPVTARFIDITPGQELLRKAREMEADLKRRHELDAAQQKQRAALEARALANYRDLVDKFLEIAERKVSVVDDYGDENWDALPEEVHKCLAKIAKRDGSVDLSKLDLRSMSAQKLSATPGSPAVSAYAHPSTRHLAVVLDSKFRAYHEDRKRSRRFSPDLRPLAGTDFETALSALLSRDGFDVSGTPSTGDQGADLIARKSGRTTAIQAKGYRGAVGNGAVQEIVGALRYYGADDGWVVTNSTFTASARALAQANNIRLIDGKELEDIASGRRF